MAGLLVTFVAQLIRGIQVIVHPGDAGAVKTIALVVAICFLIGIDRAWELIGAASLGISQEVSAFVRGERGPGRPRGTEPRPSTGPRSDSGPGPAGEFRIARPSNVHDTDGQRST
jgi:hypothetical protein